MKKYLTVFTLLLLFFLQPPQLAASSAGSYVTIVNPVRGKKLWIESDALKNQARLIMEKNLPSTWLIRYDLLNDADSISYLKSLPPSQEKGVFLEIDETWATDSLVPYIIGSGDWARPDKVLLSGYSPKERLRLIDTLFEKFRLRFGFYPVSVGAWYIDSLSLYYMTNKYHIRAVMDCSDQYRTDAYGLWGKPWGTPYIPSKFNSLVPNRGGDKLDVVKIQWAQRDPVKGYGLGVSDSTYSMQANDYLSHQGLGTDYFDHLSREYLYSSNRISQLTLGLEVGQEGAKYKDEFSRQLDLMKKESHYKVNFVTMKDFSLEFRSAQKSGQSNYFIRGADFFNKENEAFWFSTPFYRVGLIKKGGNIIIEDFRNYGSSGFFGDIYKRDGSIFLQRYLPSCVDSKVDHNGKLLFPDAVKTDFRREGENAVIEVERQNKEKSIILLETDNISIDGKPVLGKSRDPIDPRRILIGLFMNYMISAPHYPAGGIKYSVINKQTYLGFMFSAGRLAALTSQYPYFGIFEFPFQTLARFRELPKFNLAYGVNGDFTNSSNKCTIN